MLNQSFFGYKPDWIKYLGRSTELGSDRITQWKYWTGLELQKSPICSTLIPGLKQESDYLNLVGTGSGLYEDLEFAKQDWIRTQKNQSPNTSSTNGLAHSETMNLAAVNNIKWIFATFLCTEHLFNSCTKIRQIFRQNIAKVAKTSTTRQTQILLANEIKK